VQNSTASSDIHRSSATEDEADAKGKDSGLVFDQSGRNPGSCRRQRWMDGSSDA